MDRQKIADPSREDLIIKKQSTKVLLIIPLNNQEAVRGGKVFGRGFHFHENTDFTVRHIWTRRS